MNKFSLKLISLAVLTAGGASNMAQASSVLEEVVVTAQRRAENIQEVPLAVSALNKEAVREADIHNLGDIATRVPSLTFSPFAPGQSVISLRGISSNDDGAGTDNSVAVFLDDIYIGGIAGVAFDLFDVETIEVLRGPQGTLFGRNAIGGAINIRSIKPNLEEFTGSAELTLGNYDQRDVRGYITGPLSDKWAGKITLSSRQNDGYVENLLLNKRQKDENVQSARAQLLYSNDATEVLFTIDAMDEDQEDMGRIPVRSTAVPGAAEGFVALGGDRDHVLNPIDGFSERESEAFSVRWEQEFEKGTFTSITAYREFTSSWNMDSVGVPFGPPGANLGVNDNIDEDADSFQQEFRWVSNLDGDVNFVAGLFYLQENRDRIEEFHVQSGIGVNENNPEADVARDFYRQDNTTDSYAVFGQVKWNLSDKTTLNVGARYTYDEKELFNDSRAGGFGIINDTFVGTVSDDWDDFSPKIAVDYQLNDETLVYASISRGFKSGGFGAAPSRQEDLAPLEPELSTNYEIGLKADLLENTLRLNATAFYSDIEDLQFQRFGTPLGAPDGTFGVFQTQNAGNAEVAGLELEWTWLLTDSLSFSGTYSYLDSEYKDFIFVDQTGNSRSVDGQELTRTPENKLALSLDHVYALSGGQIKSRIDYRYTDDQRGDLASDPTMQPSFDLVDARIAYAPTSEKWEVALWGKNLADEEYISHIYIVGPGDIAVFGNPRTYGATFTYNF